MKSAKDLSDSDIHTEGIELGGFTKPRSQRVIHVHLMCLFLVHACVLHLETLQYLVCVWILSGIRLTGQYTFVGELAITLFALLQFDCGQFSFC